MNRRAKLPDRDQRGTTHLRPSRWQIERICVLSSRQRRQEREDKLAERVGYLELREVAAAGQHHASPSQDAGLEGAGVRVNVRDVVLTDDDQRRHGDLAQARQRSRLR